MGGEIVITGTNVVAIAGVITAITVIYKFFQGLMEEAKKPNKDTEDKLKLHDELLAKDKDAIDSLKAEQTILLQSQLVMIQHMIDGNGIEGLKQQRDQIQNYLINR